MLTAVSFHQSVLFRKTNEYARNTIPERLLATWSPRVWEVVIHPSISRLTLVRYLSTESV